MPAQRHPVGEPLLAGLVLVEGVVHDEGLLLGHLEQVRQVVRPLARHAQPFRHRLGVHAASSRPV